MAQDHRLHGFNYNVEEWFEADRYETLAICRQLVFARAVHEAAIAEKPTGRFVIRSRVRAVKPHTEGDWWTIRQTKTPTEAGAFFIRELRDHAAA